MLLLHCYSLGRRVLLLLIRSCHWLPAGHALHLFAPRLDKGVLLLLTVPPCGSDCQARFMLKWKAPTVQSMGLAQNVADCS